MSSGLASISELTGAINIVPRESRMTGDIAHTNEVLVGSKVGIDSRALVHASTGVIVEERATIA